MCSQSKTDPPACSRSTSNTPSSAYASDGRGDRATATATAAAAMLPVPSLPRPVPLRTPAHASASGCSSPPRKKAARAESPTAVAVAPGTSPPSGAAALRLRCESCNAPHDGSYGSGRFCAVHCARRTAAALKWSKKRAGQSASTSTPTTTSSRVSVRPASLPPLPPDGSNLGKRPLALVAPAIAPPIDMVRTFPFHYAQSCHATPTYALVQPPFMTATATATGATGAPLVQTTSSVRTKGTTPSDGAKGPTHEALPMTYPSGAPAAIPVAMQMPFQMPYGYAMSYGAPYVPVHYGPFQVAPAVTPSTFAATAVSSQDDSGRMRNLKPQANDQQVDKNGNDERNEVDGIGNEKDSAAAAQVLLSMRGED